MFNDTVHSGENIFGWLAVKISKKPKLYWAHKGINLDSLKSNKIFIITITYRIKNMLDIVEYNKHPKFVKKIKNGI